MAKLINIVFEVDETKIPQEVLDKYEQSIPDAFHEFISNVLYEDGHAGGDVEPCVSNFVVTGVDSGKLDRNFRGFPGK